MAARDEYYSRATQSAEDIYKRDYDALIKNYGVNLSELDKSKAASEEMAAVTRDRLMKYLPQQMRAQGINTQGVSEDAIIKAGNNYQNTMAEISANYDTSKSALDTQLTKDTNALADKRDKALLDISKEKTDYEEITKKELQAAYDTIWKDADSGSYTHQQIYDRAINQGLSAEEASVLAGYAETAFSDKETKEKESEIKDAAQTRFGSIFDKQSAREFENYLDENAELLGDELVNFYKNQLVANGLLLRSEVVNGETSEAVKEYQRQGATGGEFAVKSPDDKYGTDERVTVKVGETNYVLRTKGQCVKDFQTTLDGEYTEIYGKDPVVGSVHVRKGSAYVYLKSEKGGYAWFSLSADGKDHTEFKQALGL